MERGDQVISQIKKNSRAFKESRLDSNVAKHGWKAAKSATEINEVKSWNVSWNSTHTRNLTAVVHNLYFGLWPLFDKYFCFHRVVWWGNTTHTINNCWEKQTSVWFVRQRGKNACSFSVAFSLVFGTRHPCVHPSGNSCIFLSLFCLNAKKIH